MTDVKEKNTQSTAIILPSEYGIANEEIVRLTELHLQSLYKQTTRTRNLHGLKITDLGRKARVLTVLTIKSAVFLSKNIQEIQTAKKANETILIATGLNKLQAWLHKQGKEQEQTLVTSGRKEVIESYLDLRILGRENEKLFGDFHKFCSTVAELTRWLRIVATLNKHAKTNPQLAKLASLIGTTDKSWKQSRVYMTLIMATILERNIVLFQIKDLFDLVARLKKQQWKQHLIASLSSMNIEDTDETLADEPIVIDIIKALENQLNHHIFYFLRKVTFAIEKERLLLDECQKLMKDALEFVIRQEKTDPERNNTGNTPEFRRKVTNVLGMKNLQIAYEYLSKHPYIFSFLEEDEILRMVWFSKKSAALDLATSPYDTQSRIANARKTLTTKFSMQDIMDKLITGNGIAGLTYEFFNKNRSLFRNEAAGEDLSEAPEPKKLNATLETAMTKSILGTLIHTLQPWYFSAWLKEVETKGDIPEIKSLSKRRLIAAYFSSENHNRPQTLEKITQEYAGMQYLDEDNLGHLRLAAEQRVTNKQTVKEKVQDE